MTISNIHTPKCWANVPLNLAWKNKKANVFKDSTRDVFCRTLRFLHSLSLIALPHNNYVAPPLSASLSLFLRTHTHCPHFFIHTHTQHHTSYFMSPCVSALSLDYNVISHYTLWALCQCSRGLKLSKSSDFCHVGAAQLDNWRWKVQNFTLPPSLSFSFRSTSPPLSLTHSSLQTQMV